MPTLRFRFPGGRYHATPWGHHVNEGQVEWPPSPWRLLRALIACGFSTQRWSEVPPVARRLIEKLSSSLPLYRVPEASTAHSRHFMPIGSLDKGREKTTLVFDTWADVGDGELLVRWPCDLDEEEHRLLCELAAGLGYLGRSESWVEAALVTDDIGPTSGFNTLPAVEASRCEPGWEQISLMAPTRSTDYATWRSAAAEKALAGLPLPEGKKKPTAKLLKDRAKAVEAYPTDLIDCLTKDTAWWKGRGWSQPPGSQRVIYRRRCDAALQVGAPQQRRRSAAGLKPAPTTVLLSLTTPSGNKSALPPHHRTLPQAERFHDQLVRWLGKGQPVDCPAITGRDAQGQPLHDGHRHAHIVPLDLTKDHGRLDHLLIHAPMGLCRDALGAIRGVRRTWMKGGAGELQLAIAGIGDLEMLRRLPAPLGLKIAPLLGPPEGARTWVSRTPFIPPRFLKPRGSNSLLGQINAELASRGLPPAEQYDDLTRDERYRHFRHFIRSRKKGGTPPPIDHGFALRLHFAEPLFVEGQWQAQRLLTLGYGSHFGLGLFISETK